MGVHGRNELLCYRPINYERYSRVHAQDFEPLMTQRNCLTPGRVSPHDVCCSLSVGLLQLSYGRMGALQRGPPKILVGYVGPINNWPVYLLILRKISKIGATRCQMLRLKCTKFAFRWSSATNHARCGAYCAPPDPLAVWDFILRQ